ncbi:MAG: hypothetical protein PHD13_01410 [Methanocellales archaeon]|nr:hypothetical protein [Methanocellales archaeon]MDD3290936.1 hypothetical protein [Methanocellales archaeon]MDD3292320.1 hypothetical protein [Methanocellales archaeon]MDD5234821.1 hypothetical protein [Methanocellales archaeon]MDD5484809.1 hypothetical protein [Methanocellales archaeon]
MVSLKVFKIFEKEVIPKESEYKWTTRRIKERELKPSWKDLTDERIDVPSHLLKDILDYLEQKHFVILIGDKNTGKTWLSYAVGYNLVKNEKEVLYSNVDDNFEADTAWSEIVLREVRFEKGPLRYIIIDDCHINREESETFFQKILDEGEQNLRFLFTMRKTGKVFLEDIEDEDIFYNEGTKRECVVHLLPDEMSREHVKNIIKKFIKVEEIRYEISETELDDVAERWGTDLFWCWLRLISWNYSEGQRLSDITDDHVCNFIWYHKGEIRLSIPKRRKVLFPLSALCQFEYLKVYDLTNFLEDNRETLYELIDEGLVGLSSWRGHDFVSIPENFAELILKTMSQKVTSYRENELSEQIKIFKDYLKSKPKPPNWYSVFYYPYLIRETEKSNFAKEVLTSLWNDIDIQRIVKENVKDRTLGQIHSLINGLLWVEGKNSWMESPKAQEIRSLYLKDNYKNIQDKMKSSSARTIERYLPLLSRIVELNKFFDVFEISDYKSIINLSTISTIRRLFFSFQKQNWNVPSAAEKMAKALSEADLARLISQENASLYRLGGLIGNVMQVDLLEAKRFVEKLSEIDLSDLISRKDSIAEEKRYTKVENINYFLSKWLSFAPNDRKRIVDNISDDVWYRLIQSASYDQGFWLLWNIYVNSSNKAKCIVKNSVGDFLLQKYIEEPKEMFFLPLLGILHLCDFVIHNISLETNITRIKQMLLKLKEERRLTLLVLSLVALKVKLPSQQFGNVKGVLDEKLANFIRNAPDIRIREVLSNLIKGYCN